MLPTPFSIQSFETLAHHHHYIIFSIQFYKSTTLCLHLLFNMNVCTIYGRKKVCVGTTAVLKNRLF